MRRREAFVGVGVKRSGGERTALEHASLPSSDPATVLGVDAEERLFPVTGNERDLRAVLEGAHEAFIAMDARGVIIDWNPAAEATFGWSRREAVGRMLVDTIIPERYRESHRSGLQRYLETGEGPVLGTRLELEALHREGFEFPVELTISARRAGTTTFFNAFLHDISDRRRAALYVDAQQVVTRILAEAETEETVITRLLGELGERMNWEYGALWRMDEERGRLSCSRVWTRGGDRLAQFGAASQEITLAPGEGLPGRVWAQRRPAFVVDVGKDENFPRVRAAEEAGLHAAICFPLLSQQVPLGVIEFLTSAIGQPDQGLLEALASIGIQVAHALEHARLYEAERSLRERFSFLAEAGQLLASSLDYRRTLARLAELAVPNLADWCSIDVLREQDTIERLAVAHRDLAKRQAPQELRTRYPRDPDASLLVAKVLRSGKAEFLPEIGEELLATAAAGDRELLDILRGLGLRSAICVPLVARGRVLGALTLVSAEAGRCYMHFDVELAEQLARRAATAVENALLFQAAERGARAAQALAYVAEAVILLDSAGVVRYWNPGATALTGTNETSAVGLKAEAVIPSWNEIEHRLREGAGIVDTTPVTIPINLRGEERWLAISCSRFNEGSVFALRDVSEERALGQARSELIATASHELRTPVAAVYGAARTLLREDIELSDDERVGFLKIIEVEGERLARIVNQILLAGQLEEGDLQLAPEACDLTQIAADVVEAATRELEDPTCVRLHASKTLPKVRCDEHRFRQVLGNLLENAIKYSPDAGGIEVRLRARRDRGVVLEVIDHGIGIPPSQHERIFEKFHRLDPTQTRGVGGTGLGLYITRELVARMGGRISLRSQPGKGSAFKVELPTAHSS